MSIGVIGLRKMVKAWEANPAKLLPAYKEALPGITDDEVMQLITLFIGLYSKTVTQKEFEAKQKTYSAALQKAQKKYKGGAFPSFNFPALDMPLIDIDEL